MTRLFSIPILALLMASCSSNVDLAIDNPTKFPVEVKVDTLAVEIPAQQVVWVEMGKGKHQITLQNGEVTDFDFRSDVYMLNPTMSEYLMMEEYYGDNASYPMYAMMQKKDTVIYLGMELEGNFGVINELVNPVTWDYGPREKLPEMIQMEEGDRYTVMKKLLDPHEFYEKITSAQTSATE